MDQFGKPEYNDIVKASNLLIDQIMKDEKINRKMNLNDWDKRKVIDHTVKKNKWMKCFTYSVLEGMLNDILKKAKDLHKEILELKQKEEEIPNPPVEEKSNEKEN